MSLLKDADKKLIQSQFKTLKNPVKLIVFTQTLECQYCEDNRQLMEELAQLSDKLSLEVYNFAVDNQKVDEYRIDKIPATAIVGWKDVGIRYYGIPGGYEFPALLEDIQRVSSGESGLTQATRAEIAKLTRSAHIQVFVTPTCPYCSRAVSLAHQLAMESDYITADMVEVIEFPHLANRYGVRGVPKTVVNDEIEFVGALPEPAFVAQVMQIERGEHPAK